MNDMKNSWTGGGTALAVENADSVLAVAVHRAEPGALERLIERFEPALYSYAHGILQNPFDAQEVVQDAVLRAHRALTRQYDEARCAALALRPWLFKTVRNLCFNKRRSKTRALEQPLEAYDDNRIGPFVREHGSELERKQDAEMLQLAMAGLPVDARELIVLRFMEEMSYSDIAKTIGATEAALRGKVFRALKMLREALDTSSQLPKTSSQLAARSSQESSQLAARSSQEKPPGTRSKKSTGTAKEKALGRTSLLRAES